MKKIENKEIKVDGNKTSYKELIEVCLSQPPSEGFTFDVMRKRFKIQDVLDKSETAIKFEDHGLVEDLKKIVSGSKWNLFDRSLTQFADDIEAM